MEMGKTERGEEILLVFGGEQQRRTAACPNLPPLLFSFSPSPLSILDLVTARTGGTGRGASLGFWRGSYTVHGYCSSSCIAGPPA